MFSQKLYQASSQTCSLEFPMDYSSPSDIEDAVPNVQYISGDLFSVRPGPTSVLAHSCNCVGSWGGGIALAFKSRFPQAFQIYKAHCQSYDANPSALVGSCLLIHNTPDMPGGEYWIACLFTSVGHGNRVSPPNMIVQATRLAITDLLRQLHTDRFISTLKPGDEYIPVINLPQINAGLFRVPWEQTKAVLKEIPYRFNVFIL